MNRSSHSRIFRTILLAIAFSLSTFAQSWAGGGQHYPNGAEDFMVGALPPPGTYLINYMILAQKDSLRDNSGKKVPVDFDASVFAEVPRLVYVSPYTILGASWAAHAFLPVYSADVTVKAGGATVLDENDKGLGDIIFSPLVFGWHFGPELHAVAAVDFYAPTGSYDKDNPATQILSRNHWTIEPVLAVSYLKNGFDVSAKLMYDFNTDNDEYLNPATGNTSTLSPGQEFHFDWALGYSLQNGLSGGLVGYNYWQTTDDEVDNIKVKDNRSKVGGIGVGVKYWPKMGPFSMTFKQYWEYDAKNMPTGPQTQFKVNYAF